MAAISGLPLGFPAAALPPAAPLGAPGQALRTVAARSTRVTTRYDGPGKSDHCRTCSFGPAALAALDRPSKF